MTANSKQKTCFVLMPFAPTFQGIWEEVIRPIVMAVGHSAIRADDIFSPGFIVADVVQAIRNADFLIADLTGRNPNVFYELGIAHTLSKPVILITQSLADVPFDVKHLRVIEYADNASGIAAFRKTLNHYLASI